MHEYDIIADWYRNDRSVTVGVEQTLALAATLPNSSLILDLGCGNGMPITKALAEKGHRVVGLDSSSRMLAHFHTSLPGTPAVYGDASKCPFVAATFDAAISWGMIFHLPPVEQAKVFASVSRVLKPNGPFLFTAAEIAGASVEGITGHMNGIRFRYYAVDSYRSVLADHGFRLLNVYDDPGVSTYYLAAKVP